MAFQAVDELLSDGLDLPLGGTVYRVPAPSAEIGLRTTAIMQAAAAAADGGKADEQVLADAAERDLYRDVLGTAHDAMVADGVEWPALKHAAITSMVWIVQNKDAAERYWNSGGDPSRLAPNRAARRNSSDAASSTRPRGSTSGTKSRQGQHRGGKGAPRHK